MYERFCEQKGEVWRVVERPGCALAQLPENPETLEVEIWRGDKDGKFVTYRVPRQANQTVLDLVTWVQRHLAPELAYRFACRVGICGSCAMMVNGRPRWTCRSHVSSVAKEGGLRIAPLRNLPILRDLVVDMAAFFDKWQTAGGRFEGSRDRHDAPAAVSPDSLARRDVDAAVECINCAACYAACEVVRWRDDYMGPASLNRAWTLARDERHADKSGLRQAVAESGGTFSCHSHGACSAACPVGLEPARSIAGLKRWTLAAGDEA